MPEEICPVGLGSKVTLVFRTSLCAFLMYSFLRADCTGFWKTFLMGESLTKAGQKSAKKRLRFITAAVVALGLVGAGQTAAMAAVSPPLQTASETAQPRVLPQVVAPAGSLSVEVAGVPAGKSATMSTPTTNGREYATIVIAALAPSSFCGHGQAVMGRYQSG